jgi:hypothetical protein
VTGEGGRKRIKKALDALEEKPEGQRETLALPWQGSQRIFPVINLEIDVPLLNATSHRIQAKLEDHPDGRTVRDAPWGDEAQRTVAEILRVRHKRFEELKDDLRDKGQTDPGVITREGVLLNANTRAVALRDLDLPDRRWIRVAVLPPDATPQELAELELHLQVQEQFKDEYRLPEELLFIEELARKYRKSDAQIARDLNWASDDGRSLRRGVEKVEQRRRILVLIRHIQQMTDTPIPLTFFDDKLEQMRALETRYNAMASSNPAKAERYLTAWLVAALSGSSSVHDLRNVDERYLERDLKPHLREDKQLGEHATALLKPGPAKKPNGDPPPGVDVLDPGGSEGGNGTPPLLNILAKTASGDPATVTLPGRTTGAIDGEAFREATKRANRQAIKDRRTTAKATDELAAPSSELDVVLKHLSNAESAYRGVRKSDAFDHKRRRAFAKRLEKIRDQVAKLTKLEAE